MSQYWFHIRRTFAFAPSIWLAGLFAAPPAARADSATPIEHVVVIFQENVSFDHYFAT
jgi:phospholipase C